MKQKISYVKEVCIYKIAYIEILKTSSIFLFEIEFAQLEVKVCKLSVLYTFDVLNCK